MPALYQMGLGGLKLSVCADCYAEMRIFYLHHRKPFSIRNQVLCQTWLSVSLSAMWQIWLDAEVSRIYQPSLAAILWPVCLIWAIGARLTTVLTQPWKLLWLWTPYTRLSPVNARCQSRFITAIKVHSTAAMFFKNSSCARASVALWVNMENEGKQSSRIFWVILNLEKSLSSGCFRSLQDTVSGWISYYNGTRLHAQLGAP